MNFEKTKSQLFFESLVQTSFTARNIPARDILTISLTSTQFQYLRDCLIADSRHYFFKGLFSILNALNSLDEKLYSWSTVKLYYSVFYLLRSSLSIKGVGLYRWGRDAFYLAYDKPTFQKMDGLNRTDHKGVIFLEQKYFSNSDRLLQSNINNQTPYNWLMDKREYVNYKHKTFSEPLPPYFWVKVNELLEEKGINYLINLYLEDNTLSYCFDEDHSIIATPLQRLKLTCREFDNAGINNYIDIDKNLVTNSQINRNIKFESIEELITTANICNRCTTT